MSARSVIFYTVVAERMGLGVSDLRAWDLLLKDGPISASRFAELTGLTPGAVTGLIDRLMKAGAVKRAVDPHDRRRVILSVTAPLRSGRTSEYFDSFQAALGRLYKRYSDDEIRIIERYQNEVAALLQEETMRLRARGKPKQTASGRRRAKPPPEPA